MYCTERSYVKHSPHGSTAVSLPCNSWSCPNCEPKRRRRLRREAFAGRPDLFITLTIDASSSLTPPAAARKLAVAWRLIRKRAFREARRDVSKSAEPFVPEPVRPWRRDPRGWVPRQVTLAGDALPFLAVFERHDSGYPHLHIVARAPWIDQNWLSACMIDIADSPIVDVRRAKSKRQVSSYVTKYVGKDSARFHRTKRYWSSRDYCLDPSLKEKPPAEPGENFETVEATVLTIARSWSQRGWHVLWDGHHRIVGVPPPIRDGPP